MLLQFVQNVVSALSSANEVGQLLQKHVFEFFKLSALAKNIFFIFIKDTGNHDVLTRRGNVFSVCQPNSLVSLTETVSPSVILNPKSFPLQYPISSDTSKSAKEAEFVG